MPGVHTANPLQEYKMEQSHVTSNTDYVNIYLQDSRTRFHSLVNGEKEDF